MGSKARQGILRNQTKRKDKMNIKKHKEYLQQLLDNYKRRLENLNASKANTTAERVIKGLRRRSYCTIINICENSLRFIDSLIPDCDDLEEAAEEYLKKNWDVDNIYEEDDLDIRKTFKAGAIWQREQMMAKAVEREVKVDAGGYPYIDATELYDYENDKPLAKAGDKVRVHISRHSFKDEVELAKSLGFFKGGNMLNTEKENKEG